MIKRVSILTTMPTEADKTLDALLNERYEIIATQHDSFQIHFVLYLYETEFDKELRKLEEKASELKEKINALSVEVNQEALANIENDMLERETLPTPGDYSEIGLEGFVKMAKNEPYFILDTETTGLNEGEIVSIAIITHRGDTVLNTFVKPVKGIPADATKIHGITLEMVKDAPTWSEVAPKVREILKGQNVVVYNATYDRKMMHKSAEALGMEKTDWKAESAWYCAMLAYAEFYGDWNEYHGNYRWQRLSYAAQAEGVQVKDAHNALGDVLMTHGIIQAMIAKK